MVEQAGHEYESTIVEYQRREKELLDKLAEWEEQKQQFEMAAEIGRSLLEKNGVLAEENKAQQEEIARLHGLRGRNAELEEQGKENREQLTLAANKINELMEEVQEWKGRASRAERGVADGESKTSMIRDLEDALAASRMREEAEKDRADGLKSELVLVQHEMEKAGRTHAGEEFLQRELEDQREELARLKGIESKYTSLYNKYEGVQTELEDLREASVEKEKLLKAVTNLVKANKELQLEQEEYKRLLSRSNDTMADLRKKVEELEANAKYGIKEGGEEEADGNDSIFGELMLSPQHGGWGEDDPDDVDGMESEVAYDDDEEDDEGNSRRRLFGDDEDDGEVALAKAVHEEIAKVEVEVVEHSRRKETDEEEGEDNREPSPDELWRQYIILKEKLGEGPEGSEEWESGDWQRKCKLYQAYSAQQKDSMALLQRVAEGLRNKLTHLREEEIDFLIKMMDFRVMLEDSQGTLISKRNRKMIDRLELLDISSAVIEGVQTHAKELLADQGELKLLQKGGARELFCQMLEMVIMEAELRKKINRKVARRIHARMEEEEQEKQSRREAASGADKGRRKLQMPSLGRKSSSSSRQGGSRSDRADTPSRKGEGRSRVGGESRNSRSSRNSVTDSGRSPTTQSNRRVSTMGGQRGEKERVRDRPGNREEGAETANPAGKSWFSWMSPSAQN